MNKLHSDKPYELGTNKSIQVQNFKSPQPPRLWSTETQDISIKKDDNLDSNSDNSVQPSPVSVLEAPFEEESPCLAFKESTNSVQGSYP